MLRYLRLMNAKLRQVLRIKNNIEFMNKCYKPLELSRVLCTASDSFYNVDYDAITKGDSDLLQKLKIIMLEIEVLRQSGGRIPDNMTTEKWIDILNAKSKSQRVKQLGFWWVNEKKKENDQEKKELKRLAREESTKNFTRDNGHIFYGFGGSTIFLRIYDTAIDRCRNWKLIQAMLFSQSLVIDCGYDKNMNTAELYNCAKQLSYLFAENRFHQDPFNLVFCNADRENRIVTRLHKLIPTMYDDGFPLNITGKSYLEMFPKEKLVYLTPHCREELKYYNEDNVYIIGAIVDKVNQEPLSLGKAKAEGIKVAKFPLDRYLDWGIGTKSLTINQCLKIMLDLRVTDDWEKALEHVPKRKIRNEEDLVPKYGKTNKYGRLSNKEISMKKYFGSRTVVSGA